MKGDKDKSGEKKPVATTERKIDLSWEEMRSKVAVYERSSESMLASKPMHDIKQKMQDLEVKKAKIEAETARNYQMAERDGWPQPPYQQLQQGREYQYQKDRNQLVAELKERYESGPTLSKEFNRAKAPGALSQEFDKVHNQTKSKGKSK